jgi:hypothetical protein
VDDTGCVSFFFDYYEEIEAELTSVPQDPIEKTGEVSPSAQL